MGLFGNSEDKETEKEERPHNLKFSYTMRAVAGAYVIYLAYQILKSVYEGESSGHIGIVIAAAVAFIILGGYLVVWGVRGYMQLSKEEKEEARRQEEEIRAQEEALRKEREELAKEEGASIEEHQPLTGSLRHWTNTAVDDDADDESDTDDESDSEGETDAESESDSEGETDADCEPESEDASDRNDDSKETGKEPEDGHGVKQQ